MTGSTAHDRHRKTQHAAPTTDSQPEILLRWLKLSGYTQSVMGHGRQQW